MDRLVRQCNESVYFMVRRNDDVLLLDMVDTTQQVKITSLVGQRFPLATAAGRIFLAFESEAGGNGRRRADVNSAVVLAPAEREAIRGKGACVDHEGFGDGVACVAAPLLNSKEEAAGVLAILGPSFRMPPARIDDELLAPLREAAAAISAGLGYPGDYLGRGTNL
jgi:DNA-binding IclR family transcriptional regulator